MLPNTRVQQLIISLLDPIFVALQKKRGHHLLLCTNATLQLGIFQQHPLWESCSDYIILPHERDQPAIHELIYRLKAGKDVSIAATIVRELLDKYKINSFIAGCTEFHLLSRYLASSHSPAQPYSCIDPLTIIAHELANECPNESPNECR